jgi:ABC-type phosphate transport system permease subunit
MCLYIACLVNYETVAVVRITLLECVVYKLKDTLKKGKYDGIEMYEKDKKIFMNGDMVWHMLVGSWLMVVVVVVVVVVAVVVVANNNNNNLKHRNF